MESFEFRKLPKRKEEEEGTFCFRRRNACKPVLFQLRYDADNVDDILMRLRTPTSLLPPLSQCHSIPRKTLASIRSDMASIMSAYRAFSFLVNLVPRGDLHE